MFGAKLVIWLTIGIGIAAGSNYYLTHGVENRNSGRLSAV